MGILDKFKKAQGNDGFDDGAFDDSYYAGFDNDYNADGQQAEAPQEPISQTAQPGGMGGMGGYGGSGSSGVGGISLNGAAIELKVVRPERFENVTQIADHLLNRRTVVLNLESTSKEAARRIIDFLSGVAYSIDGELKRVANSAYVITPNNVAVSGDQLRQKQAASAPQPEPKTNDDFFADLN